MYFKIGSNPVKKTPLIKPSDSKNSKNYGSFNQTRQSVKEMEFNIKTYNSSFLVDFVSYINKITKGLIDTVFSLTLPSAMECRGSLELINLAQKGEFKFLEEKLKDYPLDLDKASILFREHLLVTALISGNANTLLTVFNWENKHLGSIAAAHDLETIYDIFLKEFEPLVSNPEFKKKYPEVYTQFEHFVPLNNLKLLTAHSFDISQIQDTSKLKEFFKDQLLEHTKEVVSKNVNKRSTLFSKSVVKTHKNDSEVISKLIAKFSDPSMTTPTDIINYTLEVVKECRAKSKADITTELMDRLDSIIINTCFTAHKLNSEVQQNKTKTQEVTNENVNEITKDSLTPK